ncbi:MAG TPA: DUF302 domain-containing protein [Cyclobacteriaceae bacterium]|nr:DUF302 domain-containing protein [Cyclobacteriaceae bacterium]
MDFFIARKVRTVGFDLLTEKVKQELKKEGFGVITEIDIKKTLKEKINVDFRNYLILGACNPQFAHRALLADDKIGVLLPCNVVIQESAAGGLEVMAFDPASAMMDSGNGDLVRLASDVRDKLMKVMDSLD